ncbi:MAG: XisI protein [Chloroflexota bacterium]
MDRLTQYRTIISQALHDYAQIPYAYGEIESKVIIDKDQNEFLIVNVGWNERRRVHGCLIHVELRDGKVWIQRDGTEEGIVKTLLQAGIPKEHIVLAFQHVQRRQYSGYAAA